MNTALPSSPSHSHPTSTHTATPPPPPPPPPPSSADGVLTIPFPMADQQNTNTPPAVNPRPPTKLPSRPRKIPKLSPDTPNPSTNQIIISPRQPRLLNQTHRYPSLSSPNQIQIAIKHLRASDPVLAKLIDLHNPPTFDSFQTPFLALTKSILYQQLAFKAGTSIYSRFVSLCGGESGVIPETVLSLTPQQLRQIGVSGRKTSYLHDLARKYQNGILSDSAIISMDDKSLFTMLTMVNGIGSWSVHMFMIFSLHRPDVLPVNDLGIRKGVHLLYDLEDLPRPSQMEQLCEKWRPYRSVACWYIWRFMDANHPSSNSGVVTAPAGAAAIALQLQTQQQQQTQQQLQQQQQQHQPHFIDPLNIINLR
ncbi:DNA-3-methyladenine glycosylase 1 [Amaranthus tricolor]|uniref:DNA-3-methyladenine glycosylase 1 n=1 Tax=Amaranthus tricolor TaxID=29722 RepID=UPI002586B637|nr:DNA-3-methyladenine glycosylase 1 [Amaranthus tricolor]XP_057543410.1 DNA-3-methyladenine glycosylase 1 [Amaranthus tricolor]